LGARRYGLWGMPMSNSARSLARLVPVVVVAVTVSACAFGRKIDYAAPAEVGLKQGSTPLAVGVLDHRPYVVSGDKSPSFVGLQRSGFGIPYNVNTQSGHPLAEDFSSSIAGALSNKGYAVQQVQLSPSLATSNAVAQVVASGAKRSIVLEVGEWKSDTLSRAALYYSLSMTVFDENTTPLARKEVSGRDDLGGSFWDIDPAASAAQVTRDAFKRKVFALFDDPAIQSALTTNPP
jgi:hypothetical protein